ncbi:hypothetical protein [Marinomonas rhodophyticola]|uniref:Uncharacterized protein n=1 Tax=Marinomonas rhodophyticola TaxID=2992803 RepID=A0ABT3KI85_9GAMM|nr:hypothetical protein [Marinomonas sp. KJ51-3]MCW4629896.1 hypothetical protein [Marinomonas sp. KJ51-3]
MENAHNDTSSSGMGSKEFTLLVALLMSITAISIDALLPALGIIGDDCSARRQQTNHNCSLACCF